MSVCILVLNDAVAKALTSSWRVCANVVFQRSLGDALFFAISNYHQMPPVGLLFGDHFPGHGCHDSEKWHPESLGPFLPLTPRLLGIKEAYSLQTAGCTWSSSCVMLAMGIGLSTIELPVLQENKWGSERWSKLFGFTQLMSGKDGMLTQFCLTFYNVLSLASLQRKVSSGTPVKVCVCVFVWVCVCASVCEHMYIHMCRQRRETHRKKNRTISNCKESSFSPFFFFFFG